MLSILKNIIGNMKYEHILDDCIANSDTAEEKGYYCRKKEGGKCPVCGEAWIKVKCQNPLIPFETYLPTCDCDELRKQEEHSIDYIEMLHDYSGIPPRYRNCALSDIRQLNPSVKKAVAQIKAYILDEHYKTKNLILYGDIGTGKTHMAVSIIRHLIKTGMDCKYVDMSDLMVKIITNKYNYIDLITEKRCILLDDLDKIHIAEKSQWAKDQLFTLFNKISYNYITFIATTNCMNTDEIKKLFPPAIISRLLSNCQFVEVFGEDQRVKNG